MLKSIIITILLFPLYLTAGSGYYGTCGGFIELSGTFYDMNDCPGSGHPDFHGAALGSVTALTIDYSEQQTWENSGDDVINGMMHYRLWTGTPSGSFIALDLTTVDLLGGGNEKRSDAFTIDLLAGLTASTTYTLEVYYDADFTYTGGGGGSGTHYLNNSGNNYQLTFVTPVAMPVQLLNFTSKISADNTVIIDWSTASEINNDYFELEKRDNKNNWSSIGKVKGNNEISMIQNYTFEDMNPMFETNYYRLKQVDYDGMTTIFNTISAKNPIRLDQSISIYPNPFQHSISINSTIESTYSYQVYDTNGVLAKEGTTQKQSSISLEDLKSGVYHLVLKEGYQENLHFRILKLK